MARSRRSLLFWVALALTLAAVFPAAIGLLQLRSNRDALLDQVQRMQILSASTAADQAALYLRSLDRAARSAARNPAMSDLGSAAAHELLRAILQEHPDVLAAAVLDSERSSIVAAQRLDSKAAVETALSLPFSTPVEIVGDGDGSWLRHETELAEGTSLVLVAVTDDLEEILRRANQLGEVETALVDGGSRVLFGEARLLAELPENLLAQAGSERFSGGAGRYENAEGIDVIAAFHPVEGASWFVVSRQPRAAADLARRKMQIATLTATLAALAIAAALSLFGYRLLILPIRRLIVAQASVAGVEAPAEGGSEIEQLESTFAQLLLVEQERETIGEVFLGRYRVVGKLGRGGSGMVFRGFDPVLQRPVALKAVPLWEAGDAAEELVGKLQAEAVHLARLSHPNIVAVYDFARKGDTAYIAMEKVEGASLDTYLAHSDPLPVREGLAISLAIAEALSAAHSVDLIHGDVKPGNVLLGRDGSMKVADFGTAQLTRAAGAPPEQLIGTGGYIAPEVLLRQGTTRSSDLFSLGVIMYEMFSGRRPFGAGAHAEVLRRTLDEEPEPLSNLRAALPDELSEITMTLLDKEPRMRPNSAVAVVESLATLVAKLGQEWKLDIEAVLDLAETHEANITQFLTQYLPDPPN